MKSKIITAIGATSLVLGMFALQGCYESNYPGYYGGRGYGYGYGRGYYSEPAVVGDYDEHRSWWGGGHRDRDEDHDESHEGWRGHGEHEHEDRD
jgi:hypothetical protein